jgi:hypothetical protein
LERPSLLALNEYVPGALVLVGGKVVESRGILKHWTGENLDRALGLQYMALRCGNEHTYIATNPAQLCRECGGRPAGSGNALLFPRFGYTTAAWDPPKRWRDLERVGEVQKYPQTFAAKAGARSFEDFGGVQGLVVQYLEEAELLLQNAGKNDAGFAVCTKCGFTMSETQQAQQGVMNLPSGFEDHPSIFHTRPEKRCWRGQQEVPVLRNKVLAAKERVDLLVFDWPNAGRGRSSELFSLGRALALAACRELEIDARELDSVLKPLEDGRRGIVLYETSPGGSGHCRQIVELGKQLLRGARDILHGGDEHHSRCARACLDCLLDFTGQYYITQLDRRGALTILDAALP